MQQFAEYRSDPEVDPYREAESFVYHPSWTAPLFKALSFVIRIMCLDSHDEQVAAWKALVRRGFSAKGNRSF